MTRQGFSELLRERRLLFDGALGTMLQQAGLPAGEMPERWALTHPQTLEAIHREYVDAGAEVITANTFQAGPHKLRVAGLTPEEVIPAAIACAKNAGAKLVALDVGPTGQLMEPVGVLGFEEAYEAFAGQMRCGEQADADIILIETFSDLYEAKAAVLAARENTDLPVICSLTFGADGRTFVGCDPVSAAVLLSSLGVDALGVNCSVGPQELLPVVRELLRYSRVPVIVQANAGLPRYENGQTYYDISPLQYAQTAAELAKMGVRLLGGCCGTTPEHIREIAKQTRGLPLVFPEPEPYSAVCSATKTVFLNGGVAVIGERINPTGKKKLKEALRENRMDYLLSEAISQAGAGADILDVNVGLPEIDEPAMMARAVRQIQGVVSTPLQIDSSDPAAIEAGARLCAGRPIINSVNGKRGVMEQVFPIAKKYGAMLVCLTLDEDGIPPTAQGRVAIARRIVQAAAEYGIPACDLLIDCLVLTVSAQQEQVAETLKALRAVKAELGVRTVLGVSNVSFGMPAREAINATFLAAALGAGLDAPILNPLSARYMEVVDSFRVLSGEDRDSTRFIAKYGAAVQAATAAPAAGETLGLRDIILQGRRGESAPKVRELLKTMQPLEIVGSYFVPALDEVGARFERGEIFLPQLMQSADTVKNGFEVVKAAMDAQGRQRQSRGRILMATVQGDIHDIGKNIVCMLLENYGYEVIDLGKDVPPQDIAREISTRGIRLAGLSALMTTTVPGMKATIELVRSQGLDCRFFVGGAVLTPDYAAMVGADYYAKDAMGGVEIANRFFAV